MHTGWPFLVYHVAFKAGSELLDAPGANHTSTMAVDSFAVTLENYGADLAAFRAFDEDASELLPYATLLAAHNTPDPVLAALAGVYEWQNTPLVFLVDGDMLEGDEQLDGIRRRLAMRGDAPYLGVVRLGQLTFYRISLDKESAASARIKLDISARDERATFPYLANQRPGAAAQPRQWITNVVLRLLDASIEKLVLVSTLAGLMPSLWLDEPCSPVFSQIVSFSPNRSFRAATAKSARSLTTQ